MSLFSRICVAVSLFAIAIFTIRAVAAPQNNIDQRKLNVIRSIYERTNHAETPASLITSTTQAHALTEMDLQTSTDTPELVLSVPGHPELKTFELDRGTKLVLDIYDTVNVLATGTIHPQGTSPISEIRTSQFALDPKLVSRAVVETHVACSYNVRQEDARIFVNIVPRGGTIQVTTAESATPATDERATSGVTSDPQVAKLESALEDVNKNQQTEQALSQLNGELSKEIHPANTEKVDPLPDFKAETPESSGEKPLAAVSQPTDLKTMEATPIQLAAAEQSAPPQSQEQPVPETKVIKAAPAVKEQQPAASEVSSAPSQKATPQDESVAPPEKRPEEEAKQPVASRMKQILYGIAGVGQRIDQAGTPDSSKVTEKAGSPSEVNVATEKVAETQQKETEKEKPTQTAKAGETKSAKAKAASEQPAFVGDPMEQNVNIDFREMELSNVVALLAQKAGINVIAGQDLSGVVTANLRNVTLRRAMDTVLRMNGLGMVEEEGIYHIVPYEEAQASKRVTETIKLDNAKASDIKKTLQDILKGSTDSSLVSISTNDTTNVLIVAGPAPRVQEFKKLAQELDIAKPVTPTITEAIKINNSEPKDLMSMVASMLTPDIGKAAIDERSRHIIVTDVPIALEQVRELIKQVDLPVKQVSIASMIVDAVLDDNAETGVDWIVNSVHKLNKRGKVIGSIQQLGLETDANSSTVTPGTIGSVPLSGRLMLGVLTGDVNIQGVIGAQVENQKAKLLANPVVVTVENKKARINITQEIPYQEFTQSLTGPAVATTAFKDIGIILEVTPRVTHDDHVIADISAKQSDTKGEVNNIPVEDKRETATTLRAKNGQTIFIGGLRRIDDEKSSKKIPVLGDIPIMSAAFRNNIVKKESTELMVFLTCTVLPDDIETLKLSPELQAQHDELDSVSKVPNAMKDVKESILTPNKPSDDPFWKWRRTR